MILNIYKPKTWTSFDVVAKLKHLLNTKKVGHAGTLDPLAEGVLLVLTDKDTKRQDEFMHLQKEYIAEFTFGIRTETFDLEQLPSLAETSQPVTADQITSALPYFIGELDQMVPAYSAVKVDGNPLYKKARQGTIDQLSALPVKRITIFDITMLDFYSKQINTTSGIQTLPTVKLKITCSSGTYIRALVRDLGNKLNTQAVMTSLIRSKVGDLDIKDSQRIEDFEAVQKVSQAATALKK
jgi:tRNA pseudouridine55 synthase